MVAAINTRVRAVLLGAVLLTLWASAGCGPAQQLGARPVDGRVVFEKGGTVRQLHDAAAAVLFESVDQPGLRASAGIDEDGRLTNVVTRKDDATEYGLVEGTHRVRLQLDEPRRGLVHPRFLSFEQSGLTVQVPSDEGLVIKVWR